MDFSNDNNLFHHLSVYLETISLEAWEMDI